MTAATKKFIPVTTVVMGEDYVLETGGNLVGCRIEVIADGGETIFISAAMASLTGRRTGTRVLGADERLYQLCSGPKGAGHNWCHAKRPANGADGMCSGCRGSTTRAANKKAEREAEQAERERVAAIRADRYELHRAAKYAIAEKLQSADGIMVDSTGVKFSDAGLTNLLEALGLEVTP